MQFMNSKTDDIMVAVYMITYNHEKYILQSVESIIEQRTNFRYKLFIGDDNSLDGTSVILASLKDKYPYKIDYTLNTTNLGASKNAINIFYRCFNSGAKYIGMCEGDDYWADRYKLQKQIDFLEANDDYAICFHRVYELAKDEKQKL